MNESKDAMYFRGPCHCEGDTATKPLLTRITLYRKRESTGYRHTGALMQWLSSVYIANNTRYMSRLYLMQWLSSEIKLRITYCIGLTIQLPKQTSPSWSLIGRSH